MFLFFQGTSVRVSEIGAIFFKQGIMDAWWDFARVKQAQGMIRGVCVCQVL